jgi:hypothetical protein
MNSERRDLPVSSASPHLDDDTLERFAAGELDPGQQARVRAHAEACPSCAALVRGVTLLQAGARQFDPAAPREGPVMSGRTWIPIGIAAALALAVLVPMMTARLRPGTEPRSGTREAPSDVPVPIGPTGQLTDMPARFEWHPFKGAQAYELRLFREDGTLLWEQRSTGTSVERRADLQLQAGRYYWQVRAVLVENGEQTQAESSLTPFEIRKP